jgi:RNA polymerase sigma-70 factor (ECF subfamily)
VRPVTDEELMAAVSARDDARAFGELYERYATLAMSVALKVVRSRPSAEEAVQDAFVAAWRHRSSFRPEAGAFRPWLMRIVRNRAIDAWRRDGVHRRSRAELGEHAAADMPRNSDEERALKGAVQALPREQYRVLDLAYFVGLTHTAIAEVLDVPLGTVKGRMRLGLQKLREADDAALLR